MGRKAGFVQVAHVDQGLETGRGGTLKGRILWAPMWTQLPELLLSEGGVCGVHRAICSQSF